MKSWEQFCREPSRHKVKHGGAIYRFINETDYIEILADGRKQGKLDAKPEINDAYRRGLEAGKAESRCPNCNSSRIGYCEECGWPDANSPSPLRTNR